MKGHILSVCCGVAVTKVVESIWLNTVSLVPSIRRRRSEERFITDLKPVWDWVGFWETGFLEVELAF